MRSAILLLFIWLRTCQSQISANGRCPLKVKILPCTCYDGAMDLPYVYCESLNSLNDLQQAKRGLVGHKFSSFHLKQSNIGVLPSDIFRGINIKSLTISLSNVSSLSESARNPPFSGLEQTLEDLEIRDTFVNEQAPLSRVSLSHLKKLKLLQFEGNVIPIIGNDWFESGPYGLKELFILDAHTKQLGSHAFTFLGSLEKLSLTGTSITEVARDMFPDPNRLEALDLSGNRLKSLPSDIFKRMPFLKEVYLDNNEFTTIDEVAFALIWSQLTHAYFDGNLIRCDSNMKWIYKYRKPEFLHGYCTFPGSTQVRTLSKLKLSDFERV